MQGQTCPIVLAAFRPPFECHEFPFRQIIFPPRLVTKMPDLKRIEREIKQCSKDTQTSVRVVPINDNLLHLQGHFQGPIDSCYEGGQFVVDIKIPDQYPFQPPKMKFITPVYHPNVTVFNRFHPKLELYAWIFLKISGHPY